MKRLFYRFVVYVLSFIVLVGGIGFFGLYRSQTEFYAPTPIAPILSLQGVEKPKYNPDKATFAVLLGSETTEGTDFMIPYEVFSRTGAFNVYAVAADNQVKTLTGGLDVIPHYSFEGLDQLLGKSPDIIAIPYITMLDEQKYDRVRQ